MALTKEAFSAGLAQAFFPSSCGALWSFDLGRVCAWVRVWRGEWNDGWLNLLPFLHPHKCQLGPCLERHRKCYIRLQNDFSGKA